MVKAADERPFVAMYRGGVEVEIIGGFELSRFRSVIFTRNGAIRLRDALNNLLSEDASLCRDCNQPEGHSGDCQGA